MAESTALLHSPINSRWPGYLEGHIVHHSAEDASEQQLDVLRARYLGYAATRMTDYIATETEQIRTPGKRLKVTQRSPIVPITEERGLQVDVQKVYVLGKRGGVPRFLGGLAYRTEDRPEHVRVGFEVFAIDGSEDPATAIVDGYLADCELTFHEHNGIMVPNKSHLDRADTFRDCLVALSDATGHVLPNFDLLKAL